QNRGERGHYLVCRGAPPPRPVLAASPLGITRTSACSQKDSVSGPHDLSSPLRFVLRLRSGRPGLCRMGARGWLRGDSLRCARFCRLSSISCLLASLPPDSRLPTPDWYILSESIMPAKRTAETAGLPAHWFQILLALADRDLHGLGIMNDVLERTGGGMRLWPGVLHRHLPRLVHEGPGVGNPPPQGAGDRGGRPPGFPLHA